jgi:hypothetical protein
MGVKISGIGTGVALQALVIGEPFLFSSDLFMLIGETEIDPVFLDSESELPVVSLRSGFCRWLNKTEIVIPCSISVGVGDV